MGYRKYKPKAVAHVYRQAMEGRVLFYSARDYIMIFMIVSLAAEKYGIQLLGFCPMIDHLHFLLRASTQKAVWSFMRDVTSKYAKYLNAESGENGPVFKDEYGLANKIGPKKIRTSINYVYNNPVEKRLCTRAEQWQWTFLAYAQSKNPFSDPIRLDLCRHALRKSVRFVRYCAKNRQLISYTKLGHLFADLTPDEAKQLIDCIIIAYNRIDYRTIIRYYGTFGQMTSAMASNTGSEHDIEEDFVKTSDRGYFRMLAFLARNGITGVDQILTMSTARKQFFFAQFLEAEIATAYQIKKFFHL